MVKYRPIFNLEQRGEKFEFYMCSLVKYVRKKNFCENGVCWKKSFHFSMKNYVENSL